MLSIDLKEQKVTLSIKEYLKDKQDETINKYVSNEDIFENQLGEIMGDVFQDLKKNIIQ